MCRAGTVHAMTSTTSQFCTLETWAYLQQCTTAKSKHSQQGTSPLGVRLGCTNDCPIELYTIPFGALPHLIQERLALHTDTGYLEAFICPGPRQGWCGCTPGACLMLWSSSCSPCLL